MTGRAGATQTIAELRGFLDDRQVLVGDDVRSRPAGFIRPGENMQAAAVVRPRSTAEVSRILATCNSHGAPVVPVSGLTGMADGAYTRPWEIALSLELMNAVEEVSVVSNTMTLQAGVRLQVAQELAADNGLLLANDLGARGSALIGGIVSTNAGGLKAVRYGTARDQVLGLEAVLADGRVVDCMTATIKNNTGIDLKHMFIGSEGTLGVVTRAVLRLRPLMNHSRTALAGCETFDQAAQLLSFMHARLDGALSSFEVMWADFIDFVTAPGRSRSPLDRTWPVTVLIEAEYSNASASERFDGIMEAAMEAELIDDAVIAGSEAQRKAIWAVREGNEYLEIFQPHYRYDVSVPVHHMRDYIAAVWSGLDAANRGGQRFTFGHAGDSNLHFVVPPGSADFDHDTCDRIIYEPLTAFRGSVSAEHGIGLVKKRSLPYSRSPVELDVMRAMKRAVDPKGILNPGKVFDVDSGDCLAEL